MPAPVRWPRRDLLPIRLTVGRDVGMAAGVERMIDPHVILSLEYLYYGFDNVALTGPISPGSFLPVTFTWSNYNVQVVRARFQLQVLNVD